MIDLDMRMTVRWEEGMVTVIKRPPGRFMGRYQDWEGGRGSYGDASNRGSTQRSEFRLGSMQLCLMMLSKKYAQLNIQEE